MSNEKKYILKWHPNYTSYHYPIIFVFISLIMLSVSGAMKSPLEKMVTAIVSGSFLLISLFFFFFFLILQHKRVLFFDNIKVWQTVKGVTYEWYWDEMTNLKVRTLDVRSPIFVRIATKTDYRLLVFVIDSNRKKEFLQICPNEHIKQEFQKLLDS